MKKRRVLSIMTAVVLLISALVVVGLLNGFAAETEIKDAEAFKTMTDGNYKLTADIDLSEADFATIASFTGTLDGNGKKITGISQPLFQTLAGTVKNLTLEGEITFTGHTGALACLVGGDLTVDGVVNKVTVNSTSGYAGGIIGRIDGEYDVVINNSKNMANVTGDNVVGGLVGGVVNDHTSNYATLRISNAENHGKITSTVVEKNVGTGGIVGYTGKYGDTAITMSVNYGEIAFAGGDAGAGGIFGGTSWSTGRNEKISVTYCANFGDVYVAGTGQRGRTAGIVARVNKNAIELTIDHCYNFGNISAMQATNDGASGIFGYSGSGSIKGSVTNCYNVGAVNAKGDCAAIGMSGDSDLKGSNNYYIVPSKAQLEGSQALVGGDRMNAVSVADASELLSKLGDGYCKEEGKNNGFPILKWQCEHSKTTVTLIAEYCKYCGEKLRDIEDTSIPFDKGVITETAENTYTVSTEGISSFISYRSGTIDGTSDIRFVCAMDQTAAKSYDDINVSITFYKEESLAKSLTLAFEDLKFYLSAEGAGNTYVAAEGDALFGFVITGASNSEWDNVILSISVADDTVMSGNAVNPSNMTSSDTASEG